MSPAICCNGVQFANIQAVIFDKDGTLAQVDTFLGQLGQLRCQQLVRLIPDIQTSVLDSFGLTHDAGSVHSSTYSIDPAGLLAVGSRFENVVAIAAHVAATGRGWLEALDIVETAFFNADQALPLKAPLTPPVPGARELLAQLKAAQLKLGLLSSDTQTHVESFAETHQLASYFSCLQGVSQAFPVKTHPQFLAQACRTLQVDPTKVLVIGDSAADQSIAAHTAGFIGVTGGWSRSFEIIPTVPFLKPQIAATSLHQITVKA
ncbi:MAG: HAD family hydrolase [Cyanobacteria bacterium P01_A01_bin.114]